MSSLTILYRESDPAPQIHHWNRREASEETLKIEYLATYQVFFATARPPD